MILLIMVNASHARLAFDCRSRLAKSVNVSACSSACNRVALSAQARRSVARVRVTVQLPSRRLRGVPEVGARTWRWCARATAPLGASRHGAMSGPVLWMLVFSMMFSGFVSVLVVFVIAQKTRIDYCVFCDWLFWGCLKPSWWHQGGATGSSPVRINAQPRRPHGPNQPKQSSRAGYRIH